MPDTVTVKGDIADFEEIFGQAPPFPIALTFEEISFTLQAFQQAYTALLFLGDCEQEELGRTEKMIEQVKEKLENSMQSWLDEQNAGKD